MNVLKKLLIFSISGTILSVILILAWVSIFGAEQYYYFDPLIDTSFGENYSEERFEQINIGMDSSEVKTLIGEPLFVRNDTLSNGISIVFEYSQDGKLIDQKVPWYMCNDYAWLQVKIKLDEKGTVISKSKGWIYD